MIHVDDLIVVAGPSCVGKSVFIKGIQDRRFPIVLNQLKLDSPALWEHVEINRIDSLAEPRERLFVHSAFMLHTPTYREIGGFEVLGNANRIRFITLWTDPQTLLKRLAGRRHHLLRGLFKIFGNRDRFRRLKIFTKRGRVYRDGSLLASQYSKWFRFCDGYESAEHWIADVSKEVPTLVPIAEWLNDHPEISR